MFPMKTKACRSAFTRVEMLVAMTLTVFVMVILSQCFVQGLETFSGLKAIGDMQEDLRQATVLLRTDLSADHFEGKRRLSDPVANLMSEKIREGFFLIGHGYPPTGNSKKVTEGTEDGIASYRVFDHFLHFTAKMRGNAREKFFAAPAAALGGLPGLGSLRTSYVPQSSDAVFQENDNVIHSAWAEIVYLLLPTGTTVNPIIPRGRELRSMPCTAASMSSFPKPATPMPPSSRSVASPMPIPSSTLPASRSRIPARDRNSSCTS